MELLKKYKGIFILLPFIFSFRIFLNHNPWKIHNGTEESRKIFVQFTNGTDTIDNDLSGSDPASSLGNTVTVAQLMQTIFDDVNNIDAAYVNLVNVSDTDYDSSKGDRLIKVTFDGASGTSSGEAEFEYGSDKKFKGCTISGKKDLLKKASDFVATMTHEIGHCLGLDHPQEITKSIMSYYRGEDIVRLQDDDKMGIIYLYAKDPSKAKEDSTMGLSCKRR